MPIQLSAAALWLNSVFASFDESVAILVHKLFQFAGPVMSPIMEFISFLGNDGICLIIIAVMLMIPKKTRKYGTAMLLGLAIGALFTNLWLKVVIARPRPYVDENSVFHQIWLVMGQHMESDKSFPSGHTTAAFASMVPLFILCRKNVSWLALVFAVLMGISR
ncbi:MAG: phosphatase PAP2 family protein, partial [Oscillospiraceae bacterium]|nr:phosphatase PAP2 family protein [Oscillospiraceae bacterium]